VNDSARPGLLAALVAVLFVAGVAGAAIHKDDEAGPTTHLASPTTSSTPSTAASLTTTSAAPDTTVAAPTTTAVPATGSGVAASGAGRVATGGSAMPNTGAPPLALPGGGLLALALASRRSARRARA
jgi:hypothetical protein